MRGRGRWRRRTAPSREKGVRTEIGADIERHVARRKHGETDRPRLRNIRRTRRRSGHIASWRRYVMAAVATLPDRKPGLPAARVSPICDAYENHSSCRATLPCDHGGRRKFLPRRAIYPFAPGGGRGAALQSGAIVGITEPQLVGGRNPAIVEFYPSDAPHRAFASANR